MKKHIAAIIALLIAAAPAAAGPAPVSKCSADDKVCKKFEQLAAAEKFEQIVDLYNVGEQYSDESRRLIGEACLALASRDNVTPQQEEAYYRGALQVKHYIAYMGLYFLYAQKDEEKALGYLREYVQTKPADTVPYVLLGESELQKKNYEQANTYLREAKRVAHAHSPRVDWLLFEANYLLKNYQFAKEMFESAVVKGKYENELKTLAADPRFGDIAERPEFKDLKRFFKVTQARL